MPKNASLLASAAGSKRRGGRYAGLGCLLDFHFKAWVSGDCACLETALRELNLSPSFGFQIILNKSLEGAEFQLPQFSKNFYVDGHVPKPH